MYHLTQLTTFKLQKVYCEVNACILCGHQHQESFFFFFGTKVAKAFFNLYQELKWPEIHHAQYVQTPKS